MNKFIQKTTSVFMCLTMVALIGAPAYATSAENESEQNGPEITESVLSVTADEKTAPAIEINEENESETVTDIPSVCDHDEEEAEETDTEDNITEEQENDLTETPDEPVISEEDILDFIQSEEIQDALEDAGVDSGDIEDEIENGNFEVIYITQEEFEQMRKDEAMSVFSEIAGLLGESASLLLLIPATPFFICVPFVGPFMLLIPLAAPVIFVASAVGMVFSPLISYCVYRNYELEPGYEIVE